MKFTNFATKQDATNHLESLVKLNLLHEHSQGYSENGVYVLDHNEYAAPDYRPTRYKGGWGIAKVTHYYIGSLRHGEPERFRVELSAYYDGADRVQMLCHKKDDM
ncbi:MAG: hypothetical protein SVC26_02470 [Pseudomonadota bacterium]|nr:hypothetical protein [Pseudomonadota bacterium]